MRLSVPTRLVLAGCVSLTALGITAFHVNTTWDARTRAIRALHATRSTVAEARDLLRVAQARLQQDHITGRRRRAARDGAQLSTELRQAQLSATEVDRDRSTQARDSKNAEAITVRQCLGGAGAALNALQANDNAGTVAALKSVDAVCRAAQGGQTGPAAQYAFDFPDPFVLSVGADEYAFATNSGGGNIQSLRRQGDGSWATNGDALGRFPDWAAWGRTWAPSVLPRPGGFVMYYTVREKTSGQQCVSRAVATAPGGPYYDTSSEPLQCSDRDAIDAEPVVAADGTPVLMWKYERPSTIVSRQLSPDGLSFAGPEQRLLGVTQGWQGGNVEAPSMLVTPVGSWLFYSANDWSTRRYATGVVHCEGPLGPCDRAGAGPLLASHDSLVGPGGGSVFRDAAGELRLAFHAYREPNVGYPANRLLFIARIDLSTGRPVLVE